MQISLSLERSPMLGEECTKDVECAVENAECIESDGINTCQCSGAFIAEELMCVDSGVKETISRGIIAIASISAALFS
ncbi:unnamed protein product [Darwinula stevensoni]|uniref:EGF-like domain-containing protein n=1 Tax=Darwinula stevensoni TaxID=69355 RepID=A0A7R8XJ22_9CRUS|nr:unnamed protein product [Darwinula stevensoni]CAG0894882.1 unnamed protein product [Darwinula stevensoni]